MLTDFITGWNLFDLIYGISSQTARKLSGDATPRTAGGIQGSHSGLLNFPVSYLSDSYSWLMSTVDAF